jgi:hypothetical protein
MLVEKCKWNMTEPYELYYLLSICNHRVCPKWSTLVLEYEIQCMSHSSLEVQVGPVLVYNTNN